MSELRQRAQKYRFWAQTPKDTKIEKSETVIPRVFAISFRGKKVYSNRTTRSMGLVGVVEGRHINVSIPVYMYLYLYCHVFHSWLIHIFPFIFSKLYLIYSFFWKYRINPEYYCLINVVYQNQLLFPLLSLPIGFLISFLKIQSSNMILIIYFDIR